MIRRLSFNSSVGILSVGTLVPVAYAHLIYAGFNSSVGILSVGTVNVELASHISEAVSIPQSEFCPLGPTASAANSASEVSVSIPQSEFCPLGLPTYSPRPAEARRFNSSVGILSVGTSIARCAPLVGPTRFNSSVGILSVGTEMFMAILEHSGFVSIPQSEFCPLGLRASAANQGCC